MYRLRSFKGKALSSSSPPRKSPYSMATLIAPLWRNNPNSRSALVHPEDTSRDWVATLEEPTLPAILAPSADERRSAVSTLSSPCEDSSPASSKLGAPSPQSYPRGGNAAVEGPASTTEVILVTSLVVLRMGEVLRASSTRTGDPTLPSSTMEGCSAGVHGGSGRNFEQACHPLIIGFIKPKLTLLPQKKNKTSSNSFHKQNTKEI